MEILPSVEIESGYPVRGAVVWLHGLGADGHDFEPIVPLLGLDDLGVRFVFPHAPRRAVTINMGLIMPAWYDIRQIDLRREHDEPGIRESAERVRALLEREKSRGIPPGKTVLAGFSQGGALALHVALRHGERLAGVLALSTYLVLEHAIEPERTEANAGLPVFQAHGTDDDIVPPVRGAAARDRLRELGHPVEWRTYAMGHMVHPEEIRDVGTWLRERL